MCFVPLSCWHSVLFFLRMCQYKTVIYKNCCGPQCGWKNSQDTWLQWRGELRRSLTCSPRWTTLVRCLERTWMIINGEVDDDGGEWWQMTLKFSHDDQNQERYGYCRHGMIVSVIHMQVPILPPFIPITYPTGMQWSPNGEEVNFTLILRQKKKWPHKCWCNR